MRDDLEVNPEKVALHTHNWTMTIPFEAFVGMSRSSTQAQRAIANHGEKYLQQLVTLIKRSEVRGNLELLYRSELYIYMKSSYSYGYLHYLSTHYNTPPNK